MKRRSLLATLFSLSGCIRLQNNGESATTDIPSTTPQTRTSTPTQTPTQTSTPTRTQSPSHTTESTSLEVAWETQTNHGGTLLAAEKSIIAVDKKLHHLNKWGITKQTIPFKGTSAVAAKQDNLVCVATLGEGYLHAIDLKDGSVAWTFEGGPQGRVPLALSKDYVVFSTKSYIDDTPSASYILRTDSGQKTTTTELPGVNGAAIASGTAFLASSQKCMAYNLASQTKRWTAGSSRTVPQVVNNSLLTVPHKNVVSRSLKDGKKLWETNFNSFPKWSPLPVEDSIIIVDRTGVAYSLDTTTGEQNWSQSLRNSTNVPPTTLGNKVAFSTADGRIIIINPITGEIIRTIQWQGEKISSMTSFDQLLLIKAWDKVHALRI